MNIIQGIIEQKWKGTPSSYINAHFFPPSLLGSPQSKYISQVLQEHTSIATDGQPQEEAEKK